MRNSVFRSFTIPIFGLLLLLGSTSPASLQTRPEALFFKHPEVEGVYEMKIAEDQTVILQVYFKDGILRTLTDGDGEVTVWQAIEGEPLECT
jgi:hypothetical protein